jgi:hypothetical protein
MKILGQDIGVLHNQVLAIVFNVWSWAKLFLPAVGANSRRMICNPEADRCISIPGPGGLDQLQVIPIKDGEATVGYNVPGFCICIGFFQYLCAGSTFSGGT